MKETITSTADQITHLRSLPAERPSHQSVALWIWRHLLLKQADAHPRGKSQRPRWHLVNILLCLILVGPSLATPFIGSQTAWAAPSRPAHQQSLATHLISQRPYCSYLNSLPDSFCSLVDLIFGQKGIIVEFFKVLGAFIQYDLVGWIICTLSAGTVSCPTTSGGTPWSFDCPVVTVTASNFSAYSYNSSTGPITTSLGTYTYTADVPAGEGTIYQKAAQDPTSDTVNDWLSGDGNVQDANEGIAPSVYATQNPGISSEPGHLIYTFANDTFDRPGMSTLTSISLGVGFIMIGPLFVMAGFQILLASLRPGSEKAMANGLEALGRVLLTGAIVGLSSYIVYLFFKFTNQMNAAVVQLHADLGYPQTKIGDQSAVSYSNLHDTPQSFRGVVMPMSLWGCVMDDFIGLMASRVANALGSMIPVFGPLLGLTGRVTEILDLVNDVGEFALLVMSVTIWGQAIARIVLLNYYIMLAPVAFACWGLPGQTGGQVTRAWFKGFLQLLFMQTVQIFILTTMPGILPDFGLMKFPHGGDLVNPPLQTFLVQLPPIITAFAAVGAPKVMMGIGPMKTVAQAGAMAGKAVGAAGMTISHMIK